MNADIYDLKNSKVGTLELPDSLFGVRWNPKLVHQVVVAQEANVRRPWAHAKTRAEVRGGGRKPWRQKGTGRARHGSIRSPIWIGGGKAHGPLKTRSYSQKVNKKMRRLALAVLLSKRFKDQEIKFFDHFEISEPKTKVLFETLKLLVDSKKKPNVLIIPTANNKNLARAGANLPKVKVLNPKSLNPRDLLTYKSIFIDQAAVSDIVGHYPIRQKLKVQSSK